MVRAVMLVEEVVEVGRGRRRHFVRRVRVRGSGGIVVWIRGGLRWGREGWRCWR
jgi:hypothetical protein